MDSELWTAVLGIGGVLGVACALRLMRPWLNPFMLSPVRVAVLAYLLVGSLGYLFYDRTAGSRGASILLELSHDTSRKTLLIFVVAAASTLGGAGYILLVRRLNRSGRYFDTWRVSSRHLARRSQRRLLAGCTAPALLIFLDIGIPKLLSRSNYLSSRGPLAGFGSHLAVAAVVVLAYLYPRALRGVKHWILVLVGTYGLIFLSMGSRRIALFPVLLAAGYYAARLDRRSAIGLGLAAVFGFYLLGLPIHLRSQDHHGAWPYLKSLHSYANEQPPWETLAVNLLVSFPIAGEVAVEEPGLPIEDLVIAVNPMPGRASGWYEVSDRHLLNANTPYSTIGELGNYGLLATAGYFWVIGGLLGYFELVMRHSIVGNRVVLALALLGLSGLFVLTTLQYPTRSATRLMLYALVIVGVARFVRVGHHRSEAAMAA